MAIQRPKLKFKRGNTYVIDQSDSSNANHPLRFTADSGATEYTHGVTITGTPGQAGATVTFNVPDDAKSEISEGSDLELDLESFEKSLLED